MANKMTANGLHQAAEKTKCNQLYIDEISATLPNLSPDMKN
jgi:hypothetical protein